MGRSAGRLRFGVVRPSMPLATVLRPLTNMKADATRGRTCCITPPLRRVVPLALQVLLRKACLDDVAIVLTPACAEASDAAETCDGARCMRYHHVRVGHVRRSPAPKLAVKANGRLKHLQRDLLPLLLSLRPLFEHKADLIAQPSSLHEVSTRQLRLALILSRRNRRLRNLNVIRIGQIRRANPSTSGWLRSGGGTGGDGRSGNSRRGGQKEPRRN